MLFDPGEAWEALAQSLVALPSVDFRTLNCVVLLFSKDIEAQSLQLSLTACQLDPPVLTLWGRPRRAKVLYPVAGLPCRGGIPTRWNIRPCLAALTVLKVR